MESDVKDAVLRAVSGDREAFARLVTEFSAALAALAYDRLGSVTEAQDAAQEAFVAAYARLGTLREAEAFPAWLYAILRNVCAQRVRKQGLDARAAEVIAAQQAGRAELTPLERLEDGERLARVRRAVEGLSPPLREAVVLRHIAGASREQTAALLEIGLDALDKRLERALRELREKLRD